MAEIKDPENTVIIALKDGPVVVELLPDVAPRHAERMKELARAGKYDNVAFHRVIDGFMAQTGDVEHANMEQDFRNQLTKMNRTLGTTLVLSSPTDFHLKKFASVLIYLENGHISKIRPGITQKPQRNQNKDNRKSRNTRNRNSRSNRKRR